jgi:lectin, mannose-binding 1
VAPGNQRGAVWSDRSLQHAQWVADVDFRANGPERGGGNLNIWLVRGGSNDIGASSIYTVGKFDGLALVIDTYAGSGGMIRGFLNDGTVDFSHVHNIDERAFGHCLYAYRNLGRPSQIKLRQTADSFKVEIDGSLCFETDKVRIPAGNQFGLTAATPDNPDSFEVFKLIVMSESLHPDHSYTSTNDQGQMQEQKPKDGQPEHVTYGRSGFTTSNNKPGTGGSGTPDDPFDSAIPDTSADTITSSKSQFADLHNRLQSVNHHVSTIFRSVAKHAQMDETRHHEVSKMIDDIKTELRRFDAVTDLVRKVDTLEKEIRGLRAELTGQVKNTEHALKGFMSDHHATLSNNIATNAPPGHGRLIFVVIASQLLLAVGYVFYKRRKNGSPKKYL